MLNISPPPAATVEPPVTTPDFAKAVAAAEEAYARSGQMLDAALMFADFGIPVFPVSARNKNPVAARLTDEDGKPIEGSGGFKRATTDRLQLEQWWPRGRHKKHSENLIGVPMGPLSGVWCADIDTKAGGHREDGLTIWNALQAEHGKIKTRQHVTASGGLHEIFKWNYARPTPNQRGGIPHGIDVKSHGGYIVVPPSRARIKNRLYSVVRDIAPVEAPAWLLEMIGRAPDVRTVIHRDPTKPLNPFQAFGMEATARGKKGQALVDIDELTDVMRYVPNDNLGWDEWTAIGLALYAAVGDAGFRLFDAFSQKAPDLYDANITARRWREIRTSPPNRTGFGKLYRIAALNGWQTAPTYQPATFSELAAARADITRVLGKFLTRNQYQLFADEACGPAVLVLPIDTGIGKTTAAVAAIAKSTKKLIHYAVPRHGLADEIAERFRALGINARVFRGRHRPDPDSPGNAMCTELDKVDMAIDAKLDVNATCCKRGTDVCPAFEECGYKRQGRDTKDVRVWIFAADLLFHRQEVLGTADLLVIDESFWQKQLRGIDDEERVALPLAQLKKYPELTKLAHVLARQEEDGGLRLDCAIYAGSVWDVNTLINTVWALIDAEIKKLKGVHPGLSARDFERHLTKSKINLRRIRFLHAVRRMTEELRDMILHDIPVSGRLRLETSESGARAITWRGVETVKQQFFVPTLILDATPPDLPILKVSHPRAKMTPEVRVAYPDSVRIRQVLDAPTSKTKLITGEASEKHRHEVLRSIQQRWMETGRKPSLVIAQLDYEKWLTGKLPPEIATAHYNDIAGLDAYKDVRLLMLIGRPQPGPEAVEAYAATLTGIMPECIGDDEAFNWYDSVRRGIRMKDGSGIAVMGDQHPDEMCEAIRRQICEAELLQALGRGRAVNRDASSRLDIDLLFDVVLPIEIDEDSRWQRPSLAISTATEGVMLESPDDMVKLWPTLWPNRKAATRTVANGNPDLPNFETVRYQLKGRNQKIRTGRFDRSLIADPGDWLQERLGPVTVKG